jgi:lysophospholipase L1-like esterase
VNQPAPAPDHVLEPTGASRWRPLAVNLALAAASIIISVGGLELTCRLIGFQTRGSWSTPCYRVVPSVGHLFIADYRGTMYKGISTHWQEVPVRINSHGLRGPDFPTEKPPGVTRVLVIGDSFAFGYLLPEAESLPAQLQQTLDARGGPARVQVINAGVPGYGIFTERAFLEHIGLGFAPDVVVLSASPGDIFDAGTQKDSAGTTVNLSREFRVYEAVRSSALMAAMEYIFFQAIARLDPKLSLTHGFHAETLSTAMERAWTRYTRTFAQLAQLARAHHVPLILMLYPPQLDLYSDATPVTARWAKLAADNGVTFVDLLPTFRPARSQGLFVPADGHPNGTANRIAAGELAAHLP